MKKTKSKILPVLVGTLLLGSLMSCGTGGGGETGGKTRITFWHTMGQQNQDLVNRMIAEFENANPDIKVEAYSQGGYTDLAGKLHDAIPAGTTPTLSFCYPDNVASYIESGAVENMADYVTNEEYGFTAEEKGQEDFIKAYWDEGANYKDPGLYSVPYAKSTEALFYNADVFEENGWEAPTTWDEMWTLCETIRTKFSATHPDLIPLGYDSDANMFITMCEQYGIPYTTKEGDEGDHYIFDNPQAKEMVKGLKEKYDKKYFVTKGGMPNNTYTSTLFTDGKILMSIGSTGGTSYNKSHEFNIGVAPIPAGSKNNHVVSQGPSICFFSRATQQEKIAAWKFYKHITNSQNTANYSIRTGYEPVRQSAYDSDAYKAHVAKANNSLICMCANGGTGNLLSTVAYLTSTQYGDRYFYSDVFDGSDVAREEVGSILSNVFLNTKSIDKAFDDAVTSCIQ